jgi:hypothetical protein
MKKYGLNNDYLSYLFMTGTPDPVLRKNLLVIKTIGAKIKPYIEKLRRKSALT